MGSCGIVPVHKGVEESPAVIPGRKSAPRPSETLGHNGFDDPFRLAVRVGVARLREALINGVAAESGNERMVLPPSALGSVVRVRLLDQERHGVDCLFEEYRGGVACFVRQDVGDEEPREVIHRHVEPLAGRGDCFPVHHRQFLGVEMDQFSGGVLFVPPETMFTAGKLFGEDALGSREMPEAIADTPVAVIDRRQVHKDRQLGLFQGAIHGGAGGAVMAREFGNGVPVNPPPVQLPSHLRQKFGILMHEDSGLLNCDLWVETPMPQFSPESFICSKVY